MTVTIDIDRPCDVVRHLKQVELELASGAKAETIRYTSMNGATREVRYTKASLAEIRKLISSYQIECDKITGGSSKRFAVSAGGFAR